MLLSARARAFPFFFNRTSTTQIYTLSLHDALPIFAILVAALVYWICVALGLPSVVGIIAAILVLLAGIPTGGYGLGRSSRRSEEHTSELQSLAYLVCRLLLEKKNINERVVVYLDEQ